jgi:hypothetical protein
LQTTMRDTSLSLLSFYHLPFTVGWRTASVIFELLPVVPRTTSA